MNKRTALVDSLSKLIGWSNELCTNTFSDDMLESTSGLVYQQAHPLLTINNLQSIAPQEVIDESNAAPAWSGATTYKSGSIVSYESKIYRAVYANTNIIPDSPNTAWIETNYFSIWVRSKVEASIAKMLLRIVDERATTFKDKSLVQTTQLQSNTYNKYNTINNKAKTYVGLELIPARYLGLGLTLADITVYTNSGPVNFSDIEGAGLYLPNTQEFIQVENNIFNFVDYLQEKKLGSIYLLYPQESLESLDKKALNTKRDWSKKPCRACSEVSYTYWSFWSRYLEVHPLAISNVEGIDDIFNVTNYDYTSTFGYGLNFNIKVYCDITSILLDNINDLKSVLFYQVAVDLLYEMLYNPDVRTNRHATNASRNDIAMALEVTDPVGRKQGLKVKLDEAYKALHINLSGISKVCLKCNNNGIKYRTV